MADHDGAVRHYFGNHTEAWLKRYYRQDFDSVSYQDRMHEALRLLRKYGGARMRVLDLGCGAGVQAAQVQLLNHQVVACDISLEMARKARTLIGPRVVLAVGEKLPFPDHHFDAVLSLGVIGYSSDPQRFLRSAYRVLRPGGLLIISSANHNLLLESICDRLSYWPDRLYGYIKTQLTGRAPAPVASAPGFYRTVYQYRDARAFDQLLSGAGFCRLGGSGVNYGRLHFMQKQLTGERTSVYLSRLLTRLSRSLPAMQRYARIYVTALRKPEVC